MRIAFMGTPDFAVPTLDALVKAGHDIAAVYTQPPRPAKRGQALQPTPIHARAETLGLEVRHPVTLRDPQAQAEFDALHLDVAVVAAYGLILPQAILDAPRHGCLNVHASLLPRWRGAAPIHRAILAGDAETGVTIMQMERGLDTGPMLRKEATAIGPYDTTGLLTDRLAAIGARLIVDVLRDSGPYPCTPQPDEGITYAHKIDKTEARIDWRQGAAQVDRQIRAFNPAPGAWFEVNGERIRVLTANILSKDAFGIDVGFAAEPGLVIGEQLAIGCGTGAIRPNAVELNNDPQADDIIQPTKVQRAGRGAMAATELLRGFPIPLGTRLA